MTPQMPLILEGRRLYLLKGKAGRAGQVCVPIQICAQSSPPTLAIPARSRHVIRTPTETVRGAKEKGENA